jgi:GTP-binding protein
MQTTEDKIVAIIGRPNVGKSTLFNRLVGRRIAIETPVPGTTRDRLFAEVSWGEEKFVLVDVAGIELGSKKEVEIGMQESAKVAIESADLILFIVDWNERENQLDKKVALMLRKSGKPVIMAVNKVDNVKRQDTIDEFKRLGFQNPIGISAIIGLGTGDLMELIADTLETIKKPVVVKKEENFDIKLAVIGRPNVGKSTLLNNIIGEKRAVVSDEAGTTRDTITVSFSHKGQKIQMTDTAGLRRPGKVEKDSIESFSVIRTERALKNCDVAVMVIDAEEGLVALDTHILGEAKEWGKGIILAINKTDKVLGDKNEYMAKTIWDLQRKLNFIPWMPIVFISALNEENISTLLNQVVSVSESRKTIIPTEDLAMIAEAVKKANSQLSGLNVFTQQCSNPPTFQVKFTKRRAPHYTQLRYLENIIRDYYPMNGSPIFIDLAPGHIEK